jgi:polyhydroxyalkanoate synthase
VKFLLAGSGHIAGVVNPPAAHKYCHWTNRDLPESADEWLASAERHEGSWWPEWNAWVSQFGGDKVAARTPGDGKLEPVEDAPGSYVKHRLDAKPASAQTPQPAA